MRHLLAISWEMPPMYGPRGAQVSRALAALVGLGWQSTVVCLDPRRGGPHWRDGREPEPLPGVELLRVSSPEEWRALRAVWRVAPALRQMPDSSRVWIGRATRVARRAAGRAPFAGLMTFAQPWSDHLIGLRLRRQTHLPWIAHFSDPWADSPYGRSTAWQRRLSHRLERDVVREADGLIFVSDEAVDLVMKKYPPEWHRKASVVPHGFVRPRACPGHGATPAACAGHRSTPGDRLRIVYTGRFYTGLRTPLGLFRALARLNETEPLADILELVLVGPHVEAFRRDADALGIGPMVTIGGKVSPEEATRLAAGADVLLVIDAPTDGVSVFLPSKLVDYLPFRKPILGLTPPSGTSAILLRRLECPTAPPDDAEAIAAQLRSLVARWRIGTLAVSDGFERIAGEFEITRTAARLDAVMTRVFDRTGA